MRVLAAPGRRDVLGTRIGCGHALVVTSTRQFAGAGNTPASAPHGHRR